MKIDNEIYKNLGQILYTISPEEAILIFSKIRLSPENDFGDFEYDYINKESEKIWFVPHNVSGINSNIMDAIISLRKFYLKNNLNNGQPIWNTAHMSLDLTTGKFDIEFEFDEIFEHEGEEFQE